MINVYHFIEFVNFYGKFRLTAFNTDCIVKYEK